MKPQSLEQNLIKKVEAAKAAVEVKIFKAWKRAEPLEREVLHAELRVLDRLTLQLNKSIREVI